MGEIIRVGDLEIDQDLTFQRRMWRVQRVGWVLMALMMAAALAGLLGPGMLSDTTAGDRGTGLEVEYERLVHFDAPTALRVRAAPTSPGGAGTPGEVVLRVSRRYLDHVTVEHITPGPEREEGTEEEVVYTFLAAEPGEAVGVVLEVRPARPGRLGGYIVAGTRRVEFEQFVYP